MIVAGFGFRGQATEASLRDALAQVMAKVMGGGAAGDAVGALATAADKADATCIISLAQGLSLPILAVAEPQLQWASPQTHSPHSLNARGTGSVAEAAALAAAGPGARLLGVRAISGDRLATAALATGAEP